MANVLPAPIAVTPGTVLWIQLGRRPWAAISAEDAYMWAIDASDTQVKRGLPENASGSLWVEGA